MVLFRGVAIADLLPSRSYTNYARLVMFSFGFQKAFERGLQADDEVFFTRVNRFYTRARSDGVNIFPELGKRQDCCYGFRRVIGPDWVHPFRSRRWVNFSWIRHFQSSEMMSVHPGYFVFAAFASAFMLKVSDNFCLFGYVFLMWLFFIPLASAPRAF